MKGKEVADPLRDYNSLLYNQPTFYQHTNYKNPCKDTAQTTDPDLERNRLLLGRALLVTESNLSNQ
jgi:hypothetical protein